jgi:hypothetical protein
LDLSSIIYVLTVARHILNRLVGLSICSKLCHWLTGIMYKACVIFGAFIIRVQMTHSFCLAVLINISMPKVRFYLCISPSKEILNTSDKVLGSEETFDRHWNIIYEVNCIPH